MKPLAEMSNEEILIEIAELRSRRAQARESAMIRRAPVAKKKDSPALEDMSEILGDILKDDDGDGTEGLV